MAVKMVFLKLLFQMGPESPCSICRWQDVPSVCSDERNLSFGKFRNEVANYQCIIGGNRADYNLANNIHEVPEFYCLSPKVWHPSLAVPKVHRLPRYKDSPTPLHLYHAVGNLTERTVKMALTLNLRMFTYH